MATIHCSLDAPASTSDDRDRMRIELSVLACVFLGTYILGCGPGNFASELAKAPGVEEAGFAKCKIKQSQTRPFIVEWKSPDRMELETRAKKGIVVVSYDGCEMHLLPHCKVPGNNYLFESASPTVDTVTIEDEDELYANLPIGAAKLEGKLALAGQLNVRMTLVGRYVAEDPHVRKDELEGDCDGATHVIAGLTTGAF